MRPNDWRMRWKLSLVIGLAVLTVSVIIALSSYFIAVNRMEKDLDTYTGRFVRQLGEQLDLYFQDIDKLAAAIWLNNDVLSYATDSDPEFRNDWQNRLNVSTIMSKQMYYNDSISGIFMVLSDGTVVTDSNQKQVYTAADFPFLNSGSDLPPRFFLTQRRNPFGTYVISYVRTMRDLSNGSLLGYLIIDTRMSELESFIRNSIGHETGNGMIEITDKQGRIVYHPDRTVIGKPAEIRNDEVLIPSIQRINGELEVVVSVVSTFTGWHIFWRAPYREVFSGILFIRNVTMAIGLFATVISILLAIRFSVRITRPLEQLQRAMKKAEIGDFRETAPVYYRDEIGQVALAFNKMLERIRQLTAEILEKESVRNQAVVQEKQARLNSLRSQINPHFLYNTLDTLMGMALLAKTEELHDGLESLARMFRYSLSSPSVVTLAEELGHVRDFFHIIQLRFDGLFSLRIEVPEDLLGEMICPLILQPLVENSVKHGLEPIGSTGEIVVRARKWGTMMLLCIEDNGVGIEEKQLSELREKLSTPDISDQPDRIGLSNVLNRIRLVYGERANLSIESEQGKYCRIHLALPTTITETAEKIPLFH